MDIEVKVLADFVGAEVVGRLAAQRITGLASLREAVDGDLSFYGDERYKRLLAETMATVVLVPKNFKDLPQNLIGLEVDDPSSKFQEVVEKFGFQPEAMGRGIHPSAVVPLDLAARAERVSVGAQAVVEDGAEISEDVEIGAGSYIGRGVVIGAGAKIYPNVTILEASEIGARVVLHPGVVIGADGFGYNFINGVHQKIKQLGMVRIDDDVEIGANTTVDRARFGRTWIGEGTKIDNQVQVGHNVVIGKHCMIVSAVALAGSAWLGDYVVLGGGVGVAGHVSIGSGRSVAARSVVTKDIPPGRGPYMGFPAAPASDEKRRIVATRRLPELFERVRRLEKLKQNESEVFL